MENEIWKDIEGYEGLYQVSSLGRVKSLERIVSKSNGRRMYVAERILKSFFNRGYEYVTLSKETKQPNLKVHRLVAEAFLPNDSTLPDVNHKDENKANNRVGNLEWCTKEYNRAYGTLNKRVKSTWRKLYARKVALISMAREVVKVYECTKDVEIDGFDRRAVDRVCKGLGHTHKGYMFAYV